MSNTAFYISSGMTLLFSTVAAGTLGFVANTILPGRASFIRSILLTFVLLLVAHADALVSFTQITVPWLSWFGLTAMIVIQTAIGSACGYRLVRIVQRRLNISVA